MCQSLTEKVDSSFPNNPVSLIVQRPTNHNHNFSPQVCRCLAITGEHKKSQTEEENTFSSLIVHLTTKSDHVEYEA